MSSRSDETKRKILFVCTGNKLRSPTAESLYQHNKNIEVKSAGVDKIARIRLTAELLEWADTIFVFEKRQRNIIHKQFKEIYARKRIICLYIPDEYEYMSAELIDLLKERLHRYLGLPDEATDDEGLID